MTTSRALDQMEEAAEPILVGWLVTAAANTPGNTLVERAEAIRQPEAHGASSRPWFCRFVTQS